MKARPDRLDQIAGCLLGGAIGDGFGSCYEGQSAPREVEFTVAPRLTDDTQLTLATCEGIIATGRVEPAIIAAAMARWFRERRLTGLGASTFKALQELTAGHHWALTGAKGERAAGNGAAMRIAPVAFFLDLNNFDQRRLLRDIARITHQHEEAYAAALAVALAVQSAANGELPMTELVAHVHRQLPDSVTRDRLHNVVEHHCSTAAEFALKFGSSGYAADSVALAILGTTKLDEIGFEGVLKELIACGGDTDTIASMAGQIMGARLGHDGLPTALIRQLEEHTEIAALANSLAAIR